MQDPSDTRGQEGHPDEGDRKAGTSPAGSEEVQGFVDQMTAEERMLVLLQKELYEGSWQAMLTDLQNRLEGRPFIFKLANRIRDDISRIEKLRSFEEKHGVQLADYVKPPSQQGVKR